MAWSLKAVPPHHPCCRVTLISILIIAVHRDTEQWSLGERRTDKRVPAKRQRKPKHTRTKRAETQINPACTLAWGRITSP